jgi:hypothetical protein
MYLRHTPTKFSSQMWAVGCGDKKTKKPVIIRENKKKLLA